MDKRKDDSDYIPPGDTIPELRSRHPAPYELVERLGSHELEGEFVGQHVEHVPAADVVAPPHPQKAGQPSEGGAMPTASMARPTAEGTGTPAAEST